MIGAPLRRETRHRRVSVRPVRLTGKPARELLRREPRVLESPAHIIADFVTACANRGTDCCDEIGRPGAEFVPHHIDGDHRHSRRQAAPAGVRGDDRSAPGVGPFSAVGYEKRHAIGCLNRQRERAVVGNDNVRIGPRGWDGRCGRLIRAPHDNAGAVHLMDPDEVRSIDLHRRGDLIPRLAAVLAGSGPQRPSARCKEVRRETRERPADQRRPARGLHPVEGVSRLREHQY